ncbi:MAG TPA: efflux RND transporter permease subunit [Gemmatimonadaceae bacterium]|nr:efflux RND transporter permease subunit [Gemmatimonadaceae bacterium]
MRWLIGTALRLRLAVVVLTIVGIVAGFRALRGAPLDVFPEFAPPLAEVQTEAPGLSTEEVEALITLPIEQALNGTPYVTTVRSKSVLGLSSVVVVFERGTDLLKARQFVGERLARVGPTLPSIAHAPVLLSPLSTTSRVMKIGITSKTLSQTELTTLVKWTVRPRLMAVKGVANVAIWGQRDRQLQVLVDPERLKTSRVTLGDITRATSEAVAIRAGGFIDSPNQRFSVTQRSGVQTSNDLARAPVLLRGGAPITLGDVTTVTEGNPPPIGNAIVNDGPGIMLIVEKHPWGNTLDVTNGVESALAALAPALPGVDVDPTIFRPATFIEMSLHNLNRALLIGCVLVIVVLGFFLRDWRTALISLTAIPVSLLTAAVLMRYYGGTLDTMVLAGLVIALGEVVDDAIIDVENIVRRLRLNRQLASPLPAFRVVLDASLEVRSAVVYASLIVALVFLPVFFLGGLAGAFFRPLATSYVIAIMASLIVALVVTPALSLMLLRGASSERSEAPLAAALKRLYRAFLPHMVGHARRAVMIGSVSLGLAVISVPFLGEEFLPHFREFDFLMHWVEKPGTSIEAMDRITLRASRELRAIPGVRNFGSHIGRAEVADEVVGPNFTELWISLDPSVPYDATVGHVQEVVDGYPGLYRDLLTYLRERVKEVLTGASATVVVRLYGANLDSLRSNAQRISGAMSNVEGVADLKVQALVYVPQVEVRIKPDVAARLGLTGGRVRDQVETLVRGRKVGEVYEADRAFDVVVWGTPEVRADVTTLASLPIELPNGGTAPLGDVADVRLAPTPNEVTREKVSRRLDITANVRGRNLGSVARDVEREVGALTFPQGYHPEFLGEYAERREASRRLLLLSLLSLVGIYLILHADFGSARLATLVFASLPFAPIGGVAAVWLTGGVLSLGSLVGFVTVIGIAARNGIMLVSHYRHLERVEGVAFGRELIVRGSEERLTPIVMTALATGLALVPLALSGTKPGHEIEHPLAIVILGGLVSSTILNLVLMPALYLRYGRSSGGRPLHEAEEVTP